MNWKEALFIGRDQLASQSGRWPDGVPKVAGEQGASILLAADRVARAGNVPWNWFPVALAVLDYRTFGDKFRIDAMYAAQIMAEDATAYLFDALAQLANALDAQGIAVPSSGGPLVEAFFGRKDGTSALTKVAAAAWPLLLEARARGESPTWVNVFEHDIPGSGERSIVPPVPTPQPPFDPTPILPRPPHLPSFGDALVWIVGGVIVYKMLSK